MTNGELVSRIINGIKAYTKDSHVSRRWILSIAKDKASWLLAQKLGEKTIVKEDNLFSTIKCFEMVPDDVVSCDIVEFRRCSSVMKSKIKLPDMVYSRLGNSIVSVTTVDGLKKYQPTTLQRYSVEQDRQALSRSKRKLFYVSDGYLYLPNSTTEVVDIVLLALDKYDVKCVSGCENGEECSDYWDNEFVLSDKLTEYVLQEVLAEVRASLSIPEDENPNLTSNQKDQTTV